MKKQFLKSKSVCKVTFTLPKEAVTNATDVKLVGEFNNWNVNEGIAMETVKDGSFRKIVELETGRDYQFRFLVDNSRWENAWDADSYVNTPYNVDNSVVCLSNGATKTATTKKATTLKVPTTKKTVKKATTKKPVAKKTVKKVTATKSPVAKKTATKKTTMRKSSAAVKASTKTGTVRKTTTRKVTATKDNLKQIEGIGPKIEKLLNAADIMTWAALAKTSVKKLKQVLSDAGSRYKMHDPTSWPKQAKLAAAGQWDKLDKLQDQLMGGK